MRMAEYPPLIISALLYHCFSRLSRRAFLFFGLFFGFFWSKHPKRPAGLRFAAFGAGTGGGGACLCRISCIRAAGEKFTREPERNDGKRPSPLPRAGEQGRSFQLFFGKSEREMGHFFSSCSCRETRSIMRAYPSAPYTRHLRTRVIVAEETPVCSLMALNVSPS